MNWCKRDNIDWLVMGSDHLLVGEFDSLPTKPIAMLPTRLGNEDGSYGKKEDASVWVIHRSAFDLPHDPVFRCYWEDYHLVYNVWNDLEFEALDNEEGIKAYHPWHPKRERSLNTELEGREVFHQRFNELHGFEFQVGRFPNVWRTAKNLRFSTSVNPE